ncbi:MAG TPA: hypothetical protein GXX22_02795 [Clostridiales bacterium]|jgi:hypothetical protein|nr:hypothetical protein [Clostridiales bacterium]
MSCRINEEIEALVALAPKSQEAGGSDTSAFVDAQDYTEVEFVTVVGALAAGKKVTVELYGGHDATGAGAVKLGEQALVAGAGGLGSGVVRISARVTANRGRYYAVKVSSDSAEPLNIAVLALGRVTHRHADNEGALNI